jgi:hypothetical protein
VIEKRITPTDIMTGIPLPIFPNSELPPVLGRCEKNLDRIGDFHHSFHPRQELLHAGLGEKALRFCRVQWAMYDDHHNTIGYHKNLVGPDLPKTEKDKFKTVVFASAGYIPENALVFDKAGEVSIRHLGYYQRSMLQDTGAIRVDDPLIVKDYLLAYTGRNGSAAMDPSMLDEFLHSSDIEIRKKIGQRLLMLASEVTTDSFSSDYSQAKKAHLLPPNRSRAPSTYLTHLLTYRSRGRYELDKRSLKLFAASLAV